jgi:hypothetical protein
MEVAPRASIECRDPLRLGPYRQRGCSSGRRKGAGGAGDSTAAYALFLEGLLRDEPGEAVYCYRAWDGSGFLCDEDWDTAPARVSTTEPTLRAEVDEHIQEVTGPAGAGHLLIPSGYLGELSQSERHEVRVLDLNP